MFNNYKLMKKKSKHKFRINNKINSLKQKLNRKKRKINYFGGNAPSDQTLEYLTERQVEDLKIHNYLIISCIFGKKFNSINFSPYQKKNSYFFTNNPNLKNEIESKGWNYFYINRPLTDNYLISSLQSKYIKFLKFLDDYPLFDIVKTIIYFDHKEEVTSNTIDEINILINNNPNKSIIIRQEPIRKKYGYKNNIYQEIESATHQLRYKENMELTNNFIKDMISSGQYSQNIIICNTGLLIFINRQNIINLLNEVYNKCIEHQQPECQIYWNLFSQKYLDKIKQIKWSDIKNIKRREM